MREILFRGKRIDNGEWIQGHYGGYTLMSGVTINAISVPYKNSIGGSLCYDVDSTTVGQYTGLTDKNGKKIFEGDILKICYDSPLFDGYGTECICYNGIVKYENALFVCKENSKRSDALCALSSNEFEIIGNIHDNPELLEVTK